ncbi:MAG TPA: VOC family protein [Steroidobacteraceae bacterium]|nr:VOC family protein [Steroidobacteraceae bacterium]
MPAPIVYFEIAGPRAAGLPGFYGEVFGWPADAGSVPASATGGLCGALREDPAEKVLYLGVADIDAALGRIEAAGGVVVLPRTVVPGVRAYALFLDPAGNRLGLVEQGGAGS